MSADDYGLYLHIPFCLRRCGYCDFFSTEGKQKLLPGYLRALIREIGAVGARREGRHRQHLFRRRDAFAYPIRIEWRCSCRKFGAHSNSSRIRKYRWRPTPARWIPIAARALSERAGSTGSAWACNRRTTKNCGCSGGFILIDETVQAFQDARRAGVANVSLDLIYGLPGQTVVSWEHTLARALSFAPEHLSLYGLTLERGTNLARAVRRGALPAPEEDAAADMYELAEEQLAAAGYRHYEISNWAKDGASGIQRVNGNSSGLDR